MTADRDDDRLYRPGCNPRPKARLNFRQAEAESFIVHPADSGCLQEHAVFSGWRGNSIEASIACDRWHR